MSYRTAAEVAEHYRTTEATLKFWRRQGKGPLGVKAGRQVLYSDEAIAEYDRQIADAERDARARQARAVSA